MSEELAIWGMISVAVLVVALVTWLGQRPRVSAERFRGELDPY